MRGGGGRGRAHRETPPPGPVCRGRGRQRRPELAGPELETALSWGSRPELRAREEHEPRSSGASGGKPRGQRWRAPRLHCGRQLRSPGGPGGLRPQSAESTRFALPEWRAEGSRASSGDLLLRLRGAGSRRRTPYAGAAILEDPSGSIAGKFWGGRPRDYRGEWREEMRQPQRNKARGLQNSG